MIANELINLLLAARDTVSSSVSLVCVTNGRCQTASMLTFSVYLLAMHPEVMDRARSEVLNTVGESAAPTYEQIKQMRYRKCSAPGV